jgi:tetratricopeptide (TPR) repeat protein
MKGIIGRIRSLFSSPLPHRAALNVEDEILRGDSFLRDGRLDDALKCYRKASQIDPGNTRTWKKEGLVLGMMGRYMEAVAAFDRAIKLDPHDPWAWIHRGFNFWRLERWREARASFERAIVIDPGDEYARHCRKVTMEEMDRKRAV